LGGEIYKNNRDNGIKKSITQYWGFLPFAGGCLGSGLGYIGGNIGGIVKEIGSQVPYLVGLESSAYSIGDRISDVAADSLHNGYSTGSQLAAIGFFAGVILTVKFKNTIKDFFRK